MKQAYNALLHISGQLVLVGQPNESQGYILPVRNCIGQHLLVLAEGLAQLTLHAVTVYGMFEATLRYTEQQLYFCNG